MATPIPPNRAALTRSTSSPRRAAGRVARRAARRRAPSGSRPTAARSTPGCAFVALARRDARRARLRRRGRRRRARRWSSSSAGAARRRRGRRRRRGGRHARRAGATSRARTSRAWRRARRRAARVVAITGSAGQDDDEGALRGAPRARSATCHATAGQPQQPRRRARGRASALEPRPPLRRPRDGDERARRDRRARARSPSPTSASSRNVGVAHAGGVGGTRRRRRAREGRALRGARARAASPSSTPTTPRRWRSSRGRRARRVVTFGRATDARLPARRARRRWASTARASSSSARGAGASARVDLPLLGEAGALDFVAALAAAEAAAGAGSTSRRSARGARARVAAGAGRVRAAPRSRATSLVIDDTYNANPASMRAALATAGRDRAPSDRRAVAVLGEMKELGPARPSASTTSSARRVAASGASRSSSAAAGSPTLAARARRARGASTVVHGERRRATPALAAAERVRPGDVVLVKARAASAPSASSTRSPQRRGRSDARSGRVIYELLYPLAPRRELARLAQRPPVRPVPHHRGDDHGDAPLVRPRAVVHPRAAAEADRPGRARATAPRRTRSRAGTPTMGGALILLSRARARRSSGATSRNPFVWATTAVTAGYGVIGYLDDYLKIKLKNSRGVPGRYKLLGQFAHRRRGRSRTPSSRSEHLPADWWEIRIAPRRPVRRLLEAPDRRCRSGVYMPFAVLVVVATSNAVNLTDGLDGLAIGPVMINAGHVPHLGVPRRRDLRHRERRAALRRRPLPRHPADRERRRALRSTAAPWSAPASASSGTTPTRRRSSWATSARSRSAAASGCAPSSRRTSSSASSSAASSSSRRSASSPR